MEEQRYKLEIATSDFSTTRAAVEGGADRIELCANLAEGGTTPSYGTLHRCRQSFSIALYPIIRPRAGDFLYSEEEFAIMMDDVKLCRQLGCDGVVIGLLTETGEIDENRTARLVEAAYPMGVTFHRAFDRCKDPFVALEQIIQAGCERILTSGQQPTVNEGMEMIAQLNSAAADRIIIMPGSGVRSDNLALLIKQTGCSEFHTSLRGKKKSSMQYMHPAFEKSEESYVNNWIDPAEVRRLREMLQGAHF